MEVAINNNIYKQASAYAQQQGLNLTSVIGIRRRHKRPRSLFPILSSLETIRILKPQNCR